MKIVTTVRDEEVDVEVDHHREKNTKYHRSDDDHVPTLYTKFHYNTGLQSALMTSSSPTLTDESEELDVSVDDDIVPEDIVDDDNAALDHNRTEALQNDMEKRVSNIHTTTNEQSSGIDTSEVVVTMQADRPYVSTTLPKRSSLKQRSTEDVRYTSGSICPSEKEKVESSATVDEEISLSPLAVDEEEDDMLLLQPQQQVHVPTSITTAVAPKSSVQFSTITVRDYPRIMGDNPASSAGPSVSIGWQHESEITVSLEEYETIRGPRRWGREMIIPVKIREELLREVGYSRAEIVKGIRDLNIVRGQRRRTFDTLHLQPFQLLAERISRKAWNVLTLGEYKRKERATLQELSSRTTGGVSPPTSSKTIPGLSSKSSITSSATIAEERSSPTTTSTTTTSNDIDDDSSSSFT